MATLSEFLLARIAEDENCATQAGHGCGYLHEHNAGWVEIELPDEHNCRPSYEARFIRINSPDRVLAECEAKRRIVAEAAAFDDEDSTGVSGDFARGVKHAYRDVVAALALPYAEHSDYRPEWRP